NNFAIAELSAAAGLFFVASLHFRTLRDRLFVGDLRRMQHHFDAVALLQFVDDRFDVYLTRAGQQKLFGLCVAGKRERWILFENLVNRDADLLFILARLWFDREGNRCFWILHWIVNDRVGFV